MIVLGVDPGATRIGIGIVQKIGQKFRALHWGLLLPEKQLIPLSLQEKLCAIYSSMDTLVQHYCPQIVGIETLIFSRNVTTALPVAHSRAVLLLAVAQRKIPCFELSPTQIKKGVTSQGNADKNQVAFMVKTLLSIPQKEKILDDITDALATAITTSHHWEAQKLQ